MEIFDIGFLKFGVIDGLIVIWKSPGVSISLGLRSNNKNYEKELGGPI
jgi:hypothetical protein